MEWLLTSVYWAALTDSYSSPAPRCTTPTMSPTGDDTAIPALVTEASKNLHFGPFLPNNRYA
jgi:hypothetical protein